MAISSGGIDLAGKDYNLDPLIQKVGALADRMDQALDGSEKLGKSLKKITNSKIKLQADFSDAEKANSILDDLYKKSQTKAIIEIETVDENGDKVKTKKVNPDHVSRVGQLEKYFKSQESAKNSMVGHWNELVQQVNENESLSISDLIKSNNKDSTTVLRYANAFEALGGDIRSVSNDLADFVDKMRELPNLQEESGNAFTVRNFKETFKYFQQLKDEAGAVFQEYNSNEAPVNIEAFKRASQAARQAADESEESSKRERDASEEAAEAAEESAKRQKAAYESVEEIKRRVGANYPKRDTREVYEDKHYNRKALNNLDDLDDIYEYGMPDEKEINKLRDIIQALQKHRRETLDEFDSDAQYYQDAINEGNDARVKNYSEYLEYDYKQLLEDVDMLDYVNKVLEQKIQEAEKLNNELEKVREKAREEYRESPWSIESDQTYNESTDDEDLWIDKNAESRLKNLQGIYGKLKDLSQEIQAEIDKSSAAFKEALYDGRDTSSYEQDLSANYQILEKYGDQMNYINSQIKAESESFTPGETWGADEIANLIQLLQNLYEEIQKITGAVSGIDTTVDLSSISDSIEQIAKALGVVDEEMDVRPLLEQFRDVGAVIDDAFGIDSLQEFKGSLQEIADILNIISLSNGVIGDGTSKAAKADQMSQRQRLQAIQAKLGKNQFNVHVKEDDSLDTQQRIAQEKEMWNTARKGYMGTYNKLKDVAKKYLIGYENNETALLSSILSNKSVGEKITNAGIDIFKEYGSAPIGLIKDDEEAVKRLQKLVGLLKEVALNEQKTVRWDTLSQLKDDMAEAGELTEEAREKINKLLNDIDSTKSSKDLVKIDDKLLSQYGLQFQDRYWEEIANTLKGAYSSDTMDSLSSKRREIYDIKRSSSGQTLKDTLLEALQNAGMSNDGEGDYSELITRITEAIARLQSVIRQGLGIKEEGQDDKVFLEELIETIRKLNELLSTNQNAGNSILGLSPDNIEAITTSFKTLETILSHIQDLVASIKFPELNNVKVESEQENTQEVSKQTYRTTKTKKTVRRKLASGGEVTTEHESSSGELQGGSSTGVSHTGDLARVDGELKDVIRDAGEAADSVAQVGKVSAPAGQTIGEKIADGLNEAAEAAEKADVEIKDVVYHAGLISRLNKAETNGRFVGSNRGTGYFGTGHYFVDANTKHEITQNRSYNKLPFSSVDISQYDNLFKANTDEIAGKLHNFLQNITRYSQGYDRYSIDELFGQFENVFGKSIMSIEDFQNKLIELKNFMQNSNMNDRSDSVSTQFMKGLGYGGVDTRGTRYADTRYGTVIYDLKEESILQANITDELEKQGDMLERRNYAAGEVWDKSEDDRIQAILDKQKKQAEIKEEFNKIYDSTKLIGIEEEYDTITSRMDEIDQIISDCQEGINNVDEDTRDFYKDFAEILGDDIVSEDEIQEHIARSTAEYQERIDQLTIERQELEKQLQVLEEKERIESEIVNQAWKQAEENVEKRYKQKELEGTPESATDKSQGQNKPDEAVSSSEVAKFEELEKQIDLVTAAILQKNSALGVEGTTAANVVAQEIKLFEQLEEQIDLVTAAILQKNDAFGVEGTVVSGVVEGELIEIEKLQKALTGVADSIAALDTFFKELGENSSLSGFVDMIDKIKSAQDSLKAFAEILSKTQEQQEQAFKNANSVKQDRDETYSEDNSTVWSKTKATLDKDGEIQYEVKTSKEKQINKQVTTSQHYVPEKDEDGNLTGAMELLKTEITNDYDAARKDIDKLQNQIIKTDAIIDRLLDEKYRAKNHEEEVAIDKRLQLASTALTNQQNRLNDYYITTKQSYDSDLVQGFNERRKNTALERQSEIDKNNARILYRETEKTNKKIKEGRKRDKKNRESNDAFAIRQLGNLDRISDKYITNGDLPQKDVDALLEKYTEIIDKIAEIRHSTIVNPEAKEEISQMLKSYQQMAVIARDNQRIATTMQASDHKAAKASQNKDMATLLNNMKLSKADTSDLENRLQSLMKTFNESDDQSKLFFENIRNQFRGINSDFIKADKEQKSYEKVAAQYDNAINRFVKAQTAFDFGDQKDPVLLDNLNKAIEALDKAEKKYIEFRKLYLSDDSISNEEILRRTSRYINQMNKKNNPQDSAIYQGAKYKQQQKEDEDNARNQLFNEKVNTRLESLALLESQLEQSGKLTDELRAKINQLVDELSHVSYGNNSLSIYDEHLKQLKISLKETSQESESFKEHWDNVLSTINKMQSTELKNGMNAQTINARLGIGQGDLFAESHDNKGNWTGALADDANSYQIKFNDLLLNIREAISLQDELNSVLKVSFKSNNPEQYAEQIQQIETRISELIGKIRELGSGDLFNNLTEQQSAQYDAIDRKFERSMFETDQIRNNQAVKNTLDIIDNLKKARSEMNDLYVQRISYPDIEQTSLWKDAVENLTEVLLKAIEARDKLRQLNKQGKITDDQLSKVEESFESAQTEGSEKLKKQLDIANKAEYEGLLQVFKNLNKVTNEFYEGTAANLLWKGDDKDLIDLSPIIQKMQQLKIEAENATKALKEMLDAGKITNDEYNKGIDLSQTANYTQKSYSKMRKAEDSVRRKERSEYVSATKSELTDYANAMTGYKKLYGKQLTGNTLTTEEVAKMAEYLETIRTIEQGWNQDKTKGIDLSNKQASAEKQILDAMENRDDTDYTENILKQQADAEQAAKAYNKMQQQIEKMYKQADWRIDKNAWTEQVDSIQDKLNNIDLGAGYENVKKQILAIQQEAQKLSKDTDWQPLAKDWQSKQLADISKWMDQNKMAAKAFREELEQLKKDIGEVGSKGMAEEWNARFQKIVAESADKGLLGKSLGDRFKDQFKNTMTSLATYYLSFQDFIRYGRQAISIITELDTQLVEMAKVSQESMNTLKAYQLETFDIASQFGTTASQIQASTADWMRLGMLYAPLFMNNEKSPIIGRIL